jgi:hypothetical protein
MEMADINTSLLRRANKSSSQTIHSSTTTLTNVIVGPVFPIAKKVFNNHTPDGAPTFPNCLHKSQQSNRLNSCALKEFTFWIATIENVCILQVVYYFGVTPSTS